MLRVVVRQVLPPPRRAVRGWSVGLLAAFLLAFGAAVIFLEAAGHVTFTSRGAFLLAAALPWFWWQHETGYSGLRGARWVVALLARLGVVALFVALLAGPRAVRRNDELSVIFAVDRSDSIGERASDAALEFVTRAAAGKPARDEAGLLVFGRRAAVELPPQKSFPFEALNSRVATDATNLQKALSLAGAVAPHDRPARVLLISDGTATEGALSPALDELAARGVPVDVLPIEYDYEHEVWLEKLVLPRMVRKGETYEAAVVLSSLTAGSGRLVLLENGQRIYEGTVEYDAGKNRFVLPLPERGGGYYEYEARIEPPSGGDGRRENNVAVNHLFLEGEGRVLVVTDPEGDPRDWRTLVRTIRRGEFRVERVEAYRFPRNAMQLMDADCVVFNNVPADAFDPAQLESLRSAVYNLGTGFLMVGGENSFGAGGYKGSAVEEVLPVRMDVDSSKYMPAGALMIVLDHSGSMSGVAGGATKQELANRAAVLAMNTLMAEDHVGLVAFDAQPTWVVPLQMVREAGNFRDDVYAIRPSGGTNIYPALSEAFEALKEVDPEKAAVRHIILLSDGQTGGSGYPGLARRIADRDITLSTVAVGSHANHPLLDTLARLTGGRPYRVENPRTLPQVFIKEARVLRRSLVQNKTFLPRVQFAASPALKGVEELPALKGYVLTTPKPRAVTVLEGPLEELPDPVLATWRHGVGKTAAFTSDLAPNWAARWMEWERFLPFVRQLLTDISRTRERGHLQVRATASGGRGVVTVEDFHPAERFLQPEVRVTGPRDRSRTLQLRQSGPRRYQATFDLWGRGRYQVVGAAASGEDRVERFVGGFAVPYSAEYLRFQSSPLVLRRIAERTGGRVLSGDETPEQLFPADRPARSSSRPVGDLFLIALACLVPLDVGVRRVQLDWAVVRGWFGAGRREPSGETMQSLLRRKSSLEFLKPDEGRRPERHGADKEGERTERPAAESRLPPPPEEGPEEELSTAERLRRLKQKWNADEE